MKYSSRWTVSTSFQRILVSCFFFLDLTCMFFFLKLPFYFSYLLSILSSPSWSLCYNLWLCWNCSVFFFFNVLFLIFFISQPLWLLFELSAHLFLETFFVWYPSHYTGQVSPYFRKPPCFPGFFTLPLHHLYWLTVTMDTSLWQIFTEVLYYSRGQGIQHWVVKEYDTHPCP